ncbi:MAG TPA: hypothetical protein VGR47_20875 [Terracidiphilus sp.]|nr:hypothetical protein [Terracidiphilus sp.]
MRAGAGGSGAVTALAAKLRKRARRAALPLCLSALVAAQTSPALVQLNETGHILVAGRSRPYIIRHLPVASFPQIPMVVQGILSDRGCLIPQTYEAHRPENVVQGSFERAGTSDWAVLCSHHGTVSLLVFFGSDPEHPFTLASAPETERLQVHDVTGVLGFNWGIDPASPEQVREAQAGMYPRPPKLSHFAVSDSVIEHSTLYHYYSNGAWTLLPTPD